MQIVEVETISIALTRDCNRLSTQSRGFVWTVQGIPSDLSCLTTVPTSDAPHCYSPVTVGDVLHPAIEHTPGL
jgi:hypothetical protein